MEEDEGMDMCFGEVLSVCGSGKTLEDLKREDMEMEFLEDVDVDEDEIKLGEEHLGEAIVAGIYL